MSKIEFKLNAQMIEKIEAYSELLDKDANSILNEALTQYFENEEKKLLASDLEGQSAMTNLDYEEFWDDVEI